MPTEKTTDRAETTNKGIARISQDGKTLIITLPIDHAGTKSASGKSLVVATTNGFTQSGAKTSKGKEISVSVNAIIKP